MTERIDLTPEAIAAARADLGLTPDRMPRHIAIIMDGNGRWAQGRGLSRSAGHTAGAERVPTMVRESARLGLEVLTLFSFSSENWHRPINEIDALMRLHAEHLRRDRETIMAYNVRLRHLGWREGLPDELLTEMDISVETSSTNTGMWLNVALNYGGRGELTDAVRHLARDVAAGRLEPDDIQEATITQALQTVGQSDPDMLVRTAGEQRISNFLLWQISYAELYIAETFWPDFDEAQLHKALHAYAGRHRRFGGLNQPTG